MFHHFDNRVAADHDGLLAWRDLNPFKVELVLKN